jgi:hypothetical protein
MREMDKPMTVEDAVTTVWRMECELSGKQIPFYSGSFTYYISKDVELMEESISAV